jgi:ABC-type cobalamin/Fe3+-siderophores transport system ATPase subunit
MTHLRGFTLRGLHGYKDLSIDCSDKASIVLAENGVGKTTLLDTLYALLSGRMSRLATLKFKSATLQFDRGEIEFSRDQAFKVADLADHKALLNRKAARDLLEYVSTEELLELLRTYTEGSRAGIRKNSILQRIYRMSPWDHAEIFMRLERIRASMYDGTYISEFRGKISEAMGGVTVLYLPTYRRIEATFDDMAFTRPSQHRMESGEEEADADQLIYFGLGDVEEKLEKMTRFIQQSMFEAYSRLSGNMLDTLLGMRQYELPLERPLDIELVRVMLGRLGKTNSQSDAELEQALRSTDVTSERYRPLTYFLRQLLTSYEASRPQELALEDFVAVINGYFETAHTDKRLRFDKEKLKVDVWHEALKTALPFGSLSSGEKQIVSVFARLILEGQKNHLILIDEPELSLSIEWQRRFLPDILKAKTCSQLLAITHSPFVFENELDRFARSISVKVHSQAN